MLSRIAVNHRREVLCAVMMASACIIQKVQADVVVPAPSLTWHFDETGVLPAAADASGNGRTGVSSGNIVGGSAGYAGGGYSGFSSTGSYVKYDFGSDVWKSNSFSMAAWVSNPVITSGTNTLIARGANGTAGNNSDVPWQIWIDGSTQTLKLGIQNWNGVKTTYSSNVLTWDANQWYEIAVTCSYSSVAGVKHQIFNVYVTAAGSTSVVAVIANQDFSTGATGLSNGKQIVIGGGGQSYNQAANGFFPGGSFGGSIDEVNVWAGIALSKDQLNQTLVSSAPEPASLGLVAAGVFLFLGRGRKQKYKSSI